MEITLPRGMKDIEQKEMAIRIWIYNKIKEVLVRYGFQLVEPSAIEHLETLRAQCGEDLKNEIYWFKDKSGRDLGLRFDLTVGLTRMVATKPELPEPIKIACISNMWRYDEPQFGRMRSFYQWDVEIYGSKESESDAEVIAVSMDIMENLGLKNYEVRINNRKLTEGFLRYLKIVDDKQIEDTLRVIDKFRKISENQLRLEFGKCGVKRQINEILKFIRISGKPEDVLKRISKILPEKNKMMEEGYDELVKLTSVLKIFKKLDKCSFDMSIVRGIGYYTGIVFEGYDKENENIGALFGGGRFDNLCKIYGKDRPATGVAGGIERLIFCLEKNNLIPTLSQSPKVFVAAVNEKVRSDALSIAQNLRSNGIPTDFDLKNRSLTNQLEYADSLGIPFVVIVGPEELKKQMFKLKDMKKKTEEFLDFDDLIKRLKWA